MNLCQDSSDDQDDQSILNSERDLSLLSEQSILVSENSANENDQSMLISENPVISEDEFKESETKAEYPNSVYADFMTLVTKHKINNVTGK